MPVLQRVLVALDGSATAKRALELALELSRQYDGELILCTVLDHAAAIDAASTREAAFRSVGVILADYDEAAKSMLRAASSRTSAAGARSSTTLLEGRPAGAIIACAKERTVDAIVMGTQGKRGLERMILGSTADGVLRMADVPTFVVNRSESVVPGGAVLQSKAIRRILVAVDDSDPSDGAVAFAIGMASAKESILLCCSVIDTGQLVDNAAIYGCDPAPFVQEVRQTASALLAAKTAAAECRTIERIVLEGNAADAILDAAVERHADLIVCGTHGRRGLPRLSMGSVAEDLVRRSPAPVAVVRKALAHQY